MTLSSGRITGLVQLISGDRAVSAEESVMGKRVFTPRKLPRVSRENEDKIFDGRRAAKPGSEKNPVLLRVVSAERESEVRAVCGEHGWACTVTVDPEQPEDTSALERLLNPLRPVVSNGRTGRNEACTCGSGKKYKKCCAVK